MVATLSQWGDHFAKFCMLQSACTTAYFVRVEFKGKVFRAALKP